MIDISGVVQPAEEALFTLITKQWGEYIVKRFIPFNNFIFGQPT